MNRNEAARIIEAEMREQQKDNELCPGKMLDKVRSHWMNEYHRQALKIDVELCHVEAFKEASRRRLASNRRKIQPIRERA